MKDDRKKVSIEESTYHSTIETFDYEITKNLIQIEEWRQLANEQYTQASYYQRLIADADRRVAFLKQRRFEVKEQQEQFRDSLDQDSEALLG